MYEKAHYPELTDTEFASFREIIVRDLSAPFEIGDQTTADPTKAVEDYLLKMGMTADESKIFISPASFGAFV